MEILSEQRASTKENVERKQARTDGEREEEDEDVVEVCFISFLNAKMCSNKFFDRWLMRTKKTTMFLIIPKTSRLAGTARYVSNTSTNTRLLDLNFYFIL